MRLAGTKVRPSCDMESVGESGADKKQADSIKAEEAEWGVGLRQTTQSRGQYHTAISWRACNEDDQALTLAPPMTFRQWWEAVEKVHSQHGSASKQCSGLTAV